MRTESEEMKYKYDDAWGSGDITAILDGGR
jgi:hypothetical protein